MLSSNTQRHTLVFDSKHKFHIERNRKAGQMGLEIEQSKHLTRSGVKLVNQTRLREETAFSKKEIKVCLKLVEATAL